MNRSPHGDTFEYIDIDAIDNNAHRIKERKLIASSKAPSRAQRAVTNGSTLFSMVRPYLENIALAQPEDEASIASTGFYVCSPINSSYSEMMYYTMLSPWMLKSIGENMRGDNSPSVRKDDMDMQYIPVAPLGEAQRIVKMLSKAMTLIECNLIDD